MKEQTLFKTTSLLYLNDALEKQSFEECEELVQVARNFGASQADIEGVLSSHLRGDKYGGRNEADQEENRLRLLKLKEGK